MINKRKEKVKRGDGLVTGRSRSTDVKSASHSDFCTEGEGDYPGAALQGPLLMTHKDSGSVHPQRVVCLECMCLDL